VSYAKQLLDADPGTVTADATVMADAIDALSDCAQACTADTSADLSEQNLAGMVKCIRLCLDCTDICTATAGVISRQAGRCWKPGWPSARAAVMSASGTRICSTAGSAPRRAGVASRPAGHCWPP